MIVANDTLKRSCEKCTKSKVKCEYSSAGCKRCIAKGFICVYRPKRKRGPQDKKSKLKKSKSSQDEGVDDEFYSAVSSYERRVWSVFFTIFKHHQRTDSSTWAWCWFAQQLRKVEKHLKRTDNTNSLKMLSTWLEALKLDILSVNNQYKQQCKFNPSLCSSCSALALSAPNKKGELYSTLPSIPIISKQDDPSQTEDDANLPVLESYNMPQGSYVTVNEAFTREFGLSTEDMNKLLEWSGGGFLPWGGDLLARLVVKETDLHEFLQILALKFKSLGSPESSAPGIYEDVSRQVPSVHIFQLWTTGDDGVINSKQSFYIRCMHRECIQSNIMSTQIKMVFKPVGDKIKESAGEKPVDTKVLNAITTRKPVKEVKVKEEDAHSQQAFEQAYAHRTSSHTDTKLSNDEVQMVDRLPDDLKNYYDWSEDVMSLNRGFSVMTNDSGAPNPSNFMVDAMFDTGPPALGGDVDLSFLDTLMPQESTQNLISPVLNNAGYHSSLDAFVGNYYDPNHPNGWRTAAIDNGTLVVSGNDGPGYPTWKAHAKHTVLNPYLIEIDFAFKNGPRNLSAELQSNGDLKWFDGNTWIRRS